MERINILIVDDSDFTRSLLKEMLSDDSALHIVGEASNGRDAITMAKELHPDLITMDIAMPIMNGLEAIEHIMASNPTPILVLTSLTDAKTAFQAVSKGALEVYRKPRIHADDQKELIQKIKSLARVKVIRHLMHTSRGSAAPSPRIMKKTSSSYDNSDIRYVIGIAASTGGPKAIAEILSGLPADFTTPILIAQHIGSGFSSGLASWFDQICSLRVKIAVQEESLLPGHIYIAPDDHHIMLKENRVIRLQVSQRTDLFTPSCDMLLDSLASHAGKRAVGVILTGMGHDGTKGLCAVHHAGGKTIAQDEKTSVVFGMPGSAIQANCIDTVLPLDRIAHKLVEYTRSQGHGSAL